MRSMSAHSDDSVAVWHYDGVSAVRRNPRLVARGAAFVLEDAGGETGPWPFRDLVAHGKLGGMPQFGLRKRPGWRIGLEEDAPEALAALLPGVKRYGGVIDRVGLIPAMIVFALVSVGVVFGVMSTPAMVTKVIPRATERELGALMIGDFGKGNCETPEGSAALKALRTRLGADPDVDIRVVRFPMVNAVTLPGGHIVIFSKLIDQAASADEVAGVLGHELGHVERRHVLEGLIREFGLSAVLGGYEGHVAGFSKALVSASYSRGAEAEADKFAIEMLRKANVSTKPAAAFFRRLGADEARLGDAGAVLGYFASHPISTEREAKFAAGAKPGVTPVLDAKQWQALRGICANAPRAKFGFDF